MKNLFRPGSLQEKIVKEIVAGHDFNQVAARLKMKRPALMSNLTQIKKKLGIKERDNDQALHLIRAQGYPPKSEISIKPNMDIDRYRGLPPTNAEIAKDNDDVDMASTILHNKIQKCGRQNGRAEIVSRILDHAIGEIKILVRTRE